MIVSFRHAGLERFFRTGSKAGIQPKHAEKLEDLLAALDAATAPEQMNAPGSKLHRLKGQHADRWSVWVSGNWRLTFRMPNNDAEVLDYEDYH